MPLISLVLIPSLPYPTERNLQNANVGIGNGGTKMRFRFLVLLSLLGTYIFPCSSATPSPDSVVRELYQQVVTRRPLGIPRGTDKPPIRHLLSQRLNQRLDAAEACEADYFRQHPGKDIKPEFPWLETGLFSGANEEAIPSAVVVDRSEQQKDGSFHVYVRLTYKESYETYGKPPDPANTFNWDVAAVVRSEGGRFVVDDIVFFKDRSTKIDSRLTDSFSGCDGPHWIGEKR
jgi:hypothetical protein